MSTGETDPAPSSPVPHSDRMAHVSICMSSLLAASIAIVIACILFGAFGGSLVHTLVWMAMAGLLAFSATFIATWIVAKAKGRL